MEDAIKYAEQMSKIKERDPNLGQPIMPRREPNQVYVSKPTHALEPREYEHKRQDRENIPERKVRQDRPLQTRDQSKYSYDQQYDNSYMYHY